MLTRVSCPEASLCAAVDADEYVVTSTAPTSGAGAWTAEKFDPGGGDVEGISCSSITLCVAVDGRGSALATSEPTGGVASWTRTEIDSSGGLSGVSCPLAELCVAVDEGGRVVTAGAWRHSVGVTTQGSGSGTVTSLPAGISCPTSCTSAYPSGSQLTLLASAASGSRFVGWAGACAGTGACELTLESDASVTASFEELPPSVHSLSVSKSGDGSGAVTSSPGGIDCGSSCSATFASGQAVTLTATATPSSRFTGWSGACAGTSATCTVALTADRSVTAAFAAAPKIRGHD